MSEDSTIGTISSIISITLVFFSVFIAGYLLDIFNKPLGNITIMDIMVLCGFSILIWIGLFLLTCLILAIVGVII